MATHTEKTGIETIERERSDVVEVKVVKGSEAFNEALLVEKPSLTNPTTILLILCTLLGFFCQTMNGYDGSLFGGLTANKQYFLAYFHGTQDGIWAGLVSAMYQIGSVCALPFVGPAIDTWGRKTGMFIGCFLVVMGTIVCGTTIINPSVHQFMGGRFLLGFGVSIASSAGPIYVVEMTHPAYRSVVTGYCNTFCKSLLRLWQGLTFWLTILGRVYRIYPRFWSHSWSPSSWWYQVMANPNLVTDAFLWTRVHFRLLHSRKSPLAFCPQQD